MQNFNDIAVKKYQWITFLAHLCLCQVHYLGIIFLAWLEYLCSLSKRNANNKENSFSDDHSMASHSSNLSLFASQQSSHLGNWPKPNKLSDLLANYNDSLQTLTILVPVFIITITEKLKAKTETISIESISNLKPIIVTAFLWISVPIICWTLSHLSSLNLFVDRYFIPKESAFILLVAYGFNLKYQKQYRKIK